MSTLASSRDRRVSDVKFIVDRNQRFNQIIIKGWTAEEDVAQKGDPKEITAILMTPFQSNGCLLFMIGCRKGVDEVEERATDGTKQGMN